ncbi:FAD binding domain-containing protein [Halarchaeum nitratireducens]|uniref:Carbon-monoxide dehydrogenase medium subunit n=1 Tax=Halarchaeum nitratireducens TaxID=489913 RepID=A0A830GCX4_9EURY|nr:MULTISPECIES: FAD binding domain-containing protein [Halarchaeum]MBP2252486.1 carbon-monoxide dehydrogenase medium subunit [Halarchaeum solikamskense]GGN20882.1 carbon-monoxide dehydrogenase medium subunit [Halarchaeum nitratireducens]
MPARYAGERVRATSVAEALDLLAATRDASVIAGGYSLLPELKDGVESPDRLVDIAGLDELSGITRGDDETRVGALTTHAEIADSAAVRTHARALALATSSVGDRQAKHQGTIAGNLVFADQKYDAPAAFLALGGRITARSLDGTRTIDADDWFRDSGHTALDDDELATEVVLPDADRSGYIRTSEYSGYAVVSVAVALDVADGTVMSARVAANGARAYPIRLSAVEARLVGAPLHDLPAADAADAALADVDPASLVVDDAAAGRYRRRLVRSYCRRALEDAVGVRER